MKKAEEMRELANVVNVKKPPDISVLYEQVQKIIELSAKAGKYHTDVLLARIPKDTKDMDDALKRLSDVERSLRKLLNDDGFVVCMKDSLVNENFLYSLEIRW